MSTKISWTNETWNPITGCSMISDGCAHCYAATLSLRRKWSSLPWTEKNAEENVILHPERLNQPLKYQPETRVFVNSMSDMCHRLVPDEFLVRIFATMNHPKSLWLKTIFQGLTKRSERLPKLTFVNWQPNIWQGVSIENKRSLYRLEGLRACGAAVKWVSFEPLLEDLGDIDLTGVQWAVCGGESGPDYRPMDHAWARRIRDQCVEQGVPFFFKQSAAFNTERGTSLIEENGTRWTWQQYPGQMTPPVQVLR